MAQVSVVVMTCTSVGLHHVEILQVELFANPRVISEVIHGEAHHLQTCRHTRRQWNGSVCVFMNTWLCVWIHRKQLISF